MGEDQNTMIPTNLQHVQTWIKLCIRHFQRILLNGIFQLRSTVQSTIDQVPGKNMKKPPLWNLMAPRWNVLSIYNGLFYGPFFRGTCFQFSRKTPWMIFSQKPTGCYPVSTSPSTLTWAATPSTRSSDHFTAATLISSTLAISSMGIPSLPHVQVLKLMVPPKKNDMFSRGSCWLEPPYKLWGYLKESPIKFLG